MKKCLIELFNACRLILNAIAAVYFLALVCTDNYLSGISVEHRVLFTFLGIYGAIGVIVNFRNSEHFRRYEESRDWEYLTNCGV